MADIMGHPAKESAWRRGWRDTVNIKDTWRWFMLEAIIAATASSFLPAFIPKYWSTPTVFGWVDWTWTTIWQAAFGVGILVFLLLVFFVLVYAIYSANAPRKQRDEARNRIKQLEQGQRPILRIGDPFRRPEQRETKTVIGYGLDIHNDGIDDATACDGTLEEIAYRYEDDNRSEDGTTFDPRSYSARPLHWESQGASRDPFNIPGQTSRGLIMFHSESDTETGSDSLTIAFHSPEGLYKRAIIKPIGELVILISLRNKGHAALFIVAAWKPPILPFGDDPYTDRVRVLRILENRPKMETFVIPRPSSSTGAVRRG